MSVSSICVYFLFMSSLQLSHNSEVLLHGKITYAEAEFNVRVRIYQSVNPSFNPDVEYMKDPIYRDVLSVDNSLFILARKLILESVI